MVRSFSFIVLFFILFVFFTTHHIYGLEAQDFIIETVVAVDGGVPSIVIDGAGRPWIGYWTGEGSADGSIHFAVREGTAWTFETVPFPLPRPVTNTIIDTTGTPAAGYSDGLTLRYLYKSGGTWITESVGGFGPNASALAADDAGRPFSAYVWSYHYIGYVSVARRYNEGWVKLRQFESSNWFNPPSADIDLVIDANGGTHMCVNPIWSEFYYQGPSTNGLETVPYNLGNFSIAVDSHSQPTISYTSDGKLSITSKSLAGWATAIVADVSDCESTDLAISDDDVPHIAYCHEHGGVTKVFYAVRRYSGGSWEIHEVDEGVAASIAVDSWGRAHLAYITRVHDPAGWDLRYTTKSISTGVEKASWSAVKSLFKQGRKTD